MIIWMALRVIPCVTKRTFERGHRVVDLTETAEGKAFIEQENEELMVEVRSRKLAVKVRSYHTKVKSFKSKKVCAYRNTKGNTVASRAM